ncbi:MAG: hypothetical protein WBF20_24430, partial [Trebonia sp.]
MDGDDEEQTADGERGAGDYLPGSGHLEQRDFRGGEPDSGDEYKQEADFGDDHAGVVIHAWNRSVLAYHVSTAGE